MFEPVTITMPVIVDVSAAVCLILCGVEGTLRALAWCLRRLAMWMEAPRNRSS